jgi:hypothetical protein
MSFYFLIGDPLNYLSYKYADRSNCFINSLILYTILVTLHYIISFPSFGCNEFMSMIVTRAYTDELPNDYHINFEASI